MLWKHIFIVYKNKSISNSSKFCNVYVWNRTRKRISIKYEIFKSKHDIYKEYLFLWKTTSNRLVWTSFFIKLYKINHVIKCPSFYVVSWGNQLQKVIIHHLLTKESMRSFGTSLGLQDTRTVEFCSKPFFKAI